MDERANRFISSDLRSIAQAAERGDRSPGRTRTIADVLLKAFEPMFGDAFNTLVEHSIELTEKQIEAEIRSTVSATSEQWLRSDVIAKSARLDQSEQHVRDETGRAEKQAALAISHLGVFARRRFDQNKTRLRHFVRVPERAGPLAARLMAGIGTVVVLGFAAVPAGASTGLSLPPEPFLDIYQEAAEESECGLDWTILAGVAGASSNHTLSLETSQPPTDETIDQAVFVVDADAIAAAQLEAFPPEPVTPDIYGQLLDGGQGRLTITDTDDGVVDAELVWDRAVGPYQFIPQTWNAYAVDGDGNGVADPQNLSDAAASSANLLCTVNITNDPEGALTQYFGDNTRTQQVVEHAAELRAYWITLQPIVEVAGITVEAGQVTENVETVVVGGVKVAATISEPTRLMLEAAAADGIVLQGWGWRSHQRQIELRAAHCVDVWLTPAAECTPPTATPGHSMHEIGEAVDFYTLSPDGRKVALTAGTAGYAWLTENAATFGFFNLPSEPWHWSTNGH